MSNPSPALRLFRATGALLAPARASAKPSKAAVASQAAAVEKPKAKKKSPAPASPRTANSRPSGIQKVTPVSPALAGFLNSPEASRSQAVKEIWAYIKLNDLQNPSNKKEIFCDEKLKSIFDGKDKVGFLEIGKLLSRHFVKTA